MRFGLFVGVALVLVPGAARAETSVPAWDACNSIEIELPGTLPANVPGIPVSASPSETTVSLLAADGTEVPTKLLDDPARYDSSILALESTLTPGATYTLRWTDECSGIRTRSFVAGAVAALPTLAGTAFVGGVEFGGIGCDSGRPRQEVGVPIYLKESSELTPYLAISTGSLVVRDAAPKVGWYAGGYRPSSRVGSVTLNCPSTNKAHYVSVKVQIPNGPTVITPEIVVPISCPLELPESCDPPAPIDAGKTDDGASNDLQEESTVRYGCAIERTGSTGVELLFVALGVVALRRARRGAAPRTSRPPSDEAR